MAHIFRQAFHLFISYSLIPSVSCLLLSLAVWGQPLRQYWSRAVIMAAVFSIYTDITFFLLPSVVHILSALTAMLVLLFVLFRPIPVRTRLQIMITNYFLSLMNEFIMGGLAILLFGREKCYDNPALVMSFMYPSSLLMLVLAWQIQKRNSRPGSHAIANLIRKGVNNRLGLVLTLFLLQLFVLVLGVAAAFDSNMKTAPFLPYAAVAASALSIVSLFIALRWFMQSREAAVRTTQEQYIDDMNRLFTTMRGQRHDFLNHVQVIQGFLKMKKYEGLERYVSELTGEIAVMNELVSIGHPALSALLQGKLMTAQARKIRLDYSFRGMERISLGALSVDLVKIVGNLIDNAMDEADGLSEGDRWVEVNGFVEGENVWLTTRNPGRVIPARELPLLFRHGYSSKDGDHSGIGLSVVKERAEFYQGEAKAESTAEGGTVFTVRLPIAGLPSSLKGVFTHENGQ